MKKGELLESKYSRDYHQSHLPLLISSKLLRSLNAGQVDLAYFSKNKFHEWNIHLIEIKTSIEPSSFQVKRLHKASDYISQVFNIATFLEVKFCKNDKVSLHF